jgi:hypothetical protein
MKKLCLACILLLVFVVGCSKDGTTSVVNENQKVETDEKEVVSEVETKEYFFTLRDVKIEMQADVTPIIKALGEPGFYFEAESCASQGLDKIYTYGGIEIHTYENNDKDYVASILFIDDTVETDEGIALFETLEDVVKAYGDDYFKYLGLYTYQGIDSKLSFLIENEEIISIEYVTIEHS